MDFTNERYVRLYVRDTVTWKRLGWDGQNALTQLLRKADRSGVIDLNGIEPWESLVVLCGAPEDQARRGMDRLLELGVVESEDGRLLFPRYLEANECKQSDAQRQRESRARRGPISRNPPPDVTKRDHRESQNVTECHGLSQDVTASHTTSQAVTPCRAVPSVPSVPGASDAPAPARSVASRPDIIGFGWVASLLGRDVAGIAPLSSFPSDYSWIGTRPSLEREAVARAVNQDPWCIANAAHVDAAHLVKGWQKYLAGRVKPVVRTQPAPEPKGIWAKRTAESAE